MSDTRVKCHPELGVLVCTDGHVMVPANYHKKEHWTLGCDNHIGYRVVRIRSKLYFVHRLVVEAFIQYPIPDGYEVDHINRDRSLNILSNLRIVSRSENQRNTPSHDRVDSRGGTHWYGDRKRYWKEQRSRYREDHRNIRIANGKKKWVPTELALELLKLPVKERNP